MSVTLSHNAYGKSRVRLTKVTRLPDRHELKEVDLAIQLEGEFAASYTTGDNSAVVPTDTMKNTVYALARHHPLADIESFGLHLARHFVDGFRQVTTARVTLRESQWQRIHVNSRPHPHAFASAGNEVRTSTVTVSRAGTQIVSGLDDLLILKTTDSAFVGYVRDAYTTLPETRDRIFATILCAEWTYGDVEADFNAAHALIRRTLLEVFATHRSEGVQHTLYAMGEAALAACAAIRRITLTMPNKHRLLANLAPFKLDNPNEIFVTTDEPHGLISGTIERR